MAEQNTPTFPDDATDDERVAWVNAIANMRVIDAVYRAAGMQPRGGELEAGREEGAEP